MKRNGATKKYNGDDFMIRERIGDDEEEKIVPGALACPQRVLTKMFSSSHESSIHYYHHTAIHFSYKVVLAV